VTLGISAEHRELHQSARGWVDRHAPVAVARAVLDAPHDELPAFWPELIATGWLGLAVSEARGGDGFGLGELAVVLEETGRAVVPGPFLPTALAAVGLDRFASDELAAQLVPDLVAGERIGTVALGPPLRGRREASAIRIEGELRPVMSGALADVVIAPVAFDDGDATWVVLDRAGIEVEELPSLDPTRRLAGIAVEGITVSPERELRHAMPFGVRELTAVLLSAEACGLMGWCVDTAAAYAADRVQFGRPIGQFQAVKHRCADMLCHLEEARAAAWDAARGGDEKESALAAAVAGAIAPARAFQVAKDCIQVHGGIGFTWEHDAHLYLRRVTTTYHLLDGAGPWRAAVADFAGQGVRRSLSFDLPAEAEQYRPSVRAFVEEVHALPKEAWNRRIADAGYLVPHWPEPWGLGADPLHQLVIDEEFERARLRRPHLAVGMWVLPTLIAHGTSAQQERFIEPTMRLELTWCQLFSEPGAGSDLASLSTRAERVDGGWELSGQKVWTTLAQFANWGICLARTNPSKPKHEGISCFLVDMASAGIEIRPLRELTGQEMFNEVFFDRVFVPDDCVVGEVDGGWVAARTTLANERVSMGSGSSFGPGTEAVLALLAGQDALAGDARVVDEVGAIVAEGHAIAVMGTRMTMLALSGHDAGAEASVKKLLGVEYEQRVQEVGLSLLGPGSAVVDVVGKPWIDGFLGNRALSIAGGTSEVQRNVIAERLLGLPKDP
jgi:alkylation response protein AidB-like acyl-CoA dehydrogenase